MTLAAFGVTGDLMRLKILPALHALHLKGTLPSSFRIIGISRRPWSDAQLQSYIQEVLPHADASFVSFFVFLQGDAEDPATFSALLRLCADEELLIYLSLSPALYKTVFNNMRSAGFVARKDATRVMIEKPLGTSGAAAEELYAQLQALVADTHLYFVDHYVAKDWVQDLKRLPVAREDISRIHIRLFETLGVEKRGVSYDQLGALRDVGQNHALQMVANILAPALSHAERAQALEQLPLLSSAEVAAHTTRAQYVGYGDIKGVAPASQTETYFSIHTTLRAEGWEGVGLTIEAGKALPSSSKQAILSLKDGRKIELSESPNRVGEYELLFSAAIQGDQTLFPSMQEIRAQWRFIDPILAAWSSGMPKLLSYAVGTLPEGAL